MTQSSIDTLIQELYSSNDPVCYEAAQKLYEFKQTSEHTEKKLADISLAAKYMMESLIEINNLARERDKVNRYKNSAERSLAKSRELELRLRECSNIAVDTINLKSVKRAYERMYYE